MVTAARRSTGTTSTGGQLAVLAQACERFGADLLAYCQMGNHYHLVLHTRQGNLSRLMRQLNGVYTQAFNRRHGLVGHLFQGRFKAILVDREAYLLALCRYVERNPVAAGLVARPEDWPWSSCQAHLGWGASPDRLDTAALHAQMLERLAETDADRQAAAARYADLVGAVHADDTSFWTDAVRGQVFMGDDDLAARMQSRAEPAPLVTKAIPKAQRGPARSWSQHLAACGGDQGGALCAGYRGGTFTMPQLAAHAGLSVSQVSRLIAAGVKLAKRET